MATGNHHIVLPPEAIKHDAAAALAKACGPLRADFRDATTAIPD
jgi:hypothetical protein